MSVEQQILWGNKKSKQPAASNAYILRDHFVRHVRRLVPIPKSRKSIIANLEDAIAIDEQIARFYVSMKNVG